MPNVITFYCCGSGSHRNQLTKYAVPKLYSIDVGRLYRGQHAQQRSFVCDGPGGAQVIKAESILQSVESGTGSSTGGWFGTSFRSGTISELRTDTPERHGGTWQQSVFGGTTQDNVVLCLQFMWEKFYELNGNLDAINMTGWSRGGVTTIMLAHAIKESGILNINPNIEVNIFAFDPVPGGVNDFGAGFTSIFQSRTFEKTGRVGSPYTLSSCVTRYSSIMQENLDYGIGNGVFKCTVPRPEPGCCAIVTHYPLPGRHGTGCSYNDPTNHIGKIGIHLAQQFLKDNGTRFDEDYTKTDNELIELYAAGRMQFVQKNGVFSRKKTAKLKPSKYRNTLVPNDRRDHKFFVNSHHADLIRLGYPSLYGFLERGEAMSQGDSIRAQNALPVTFLMLTQLGII